MSSLASAMVVHREESGGSVLSGTLRTMTVHLDDSGVEGALSMLA